MIKIVKGQARAFCDFCGAALRRTQPQEGFCPRCKAPRPFLVEWRDELREQWTDVAQSQNVNIVHGKDGVEVRVPRFDFRRPQTMEENPDYGMIRDMLIGHGVDFHESGFAVVTFKIPEKWDQKVVTWCDGQGHGLRITGGGVECSLEVRFHRELHITTTANLRKAQALARAFSFGGGEK